MIYVTLDFETFYDADYSLSKITTEEYINDPRFQVIGVAAKVGNGPTTWTPSSACGVEPEHALHSVDWSDACLIAQNARFDAAILAWRYGIYPKRVLCTKMAADPWYVLHGSSSLKNLAVYYGLGEKGTEVEDFKGYRLEDFTAEQLARYGEYCRNDVELTYKLAKVLFAKLPPRELAIIDITNRLYTERKLMLDVPLLERHLADVRAKKEALLTECGIDKAALMSNLKFADVLSGLGVEPPMKTNAKGAPAFAFAKTDKGLQDLLEHEDPRVQAVVAARLGTKSTLEETRTEAFIGIAERNAGYLPVPLKYYGAHTGRWSGADKVNLQNLPRGGVLRQSVKAPPGHKIVAVDLNAIELRVCRALAGEAAIVERLRAGQDVYCEFPSEVFGEIVTKKTHPLLRDWGKVAELSLQFGVGDAKFADMCRIKRVPPPPPRSAEKWRLRHPAIVQLWAEATEAIRYMATGGSGYVWRELLTVHRERIELPNGMSLHYPKLRQERNDSGKLEWVYGEGRNQSRIYGGLLVENVVQALARIVVADHIVELAKRWPMALTVHDEVVMVPRSEDAEACLADALRVMSTSPAWWPELPVAAEGHIGDNYLEAK